MLLNYLKVAVRTFFKHKSFFVINVLGLAIGMPVCLLLILVVSGQRNLDQFHTNKDRVFRLITRVTEKTTGSVNDLASAPAPLGPILKTELDEVEDAVRLLGFTGAAKCEQRLISVEGFYAEQSYFDIFSFALRSGNRETALREPYSAVISVDLGKKMFGELNPMGRVLTFSFGDVVITGVLEPLVPGQRTHLTREMLISFSTLKARGGNLADPGDPNDWYDHTRFYQYVLLTRSEKAPLVEAAIPRLLDGALRREAPYDYQCSLQPLTGIALGPELVNQIGGIMEGTVLVIFLVVSLVIMVPVIFNYISLTVAWSLKRSREFGLRKVVGARRGHIVGQVLFESVMVAMVALVPAIALIEVLLPVFNGFQFVEYLAVDWTSDWHVYAFFVLFSVGTGLLAGIIPAVVLSAVRPAAALKGLSRIRGFSGLTLRKVFLVIQFVLSLFFIVLTTLFHHQVSYMLTADYGFDKEHIVSVRLQDTPYELLRNELSRQAGILGVSAASHPIGRVNMIPTLPIRSTNISEPLRAVDFSVSENHLENLGFTLLAGRSFSRSFSTDSSEAIIVNVTAARRLGFADPNAAVGRTVIIGQNAVMHIVGVTSDFHYSRLQSSIDPVVLRFSPERFAYAMVRIAPNDMRTAMAGIENVWLKLNVDLKPLRYQFMDEFILGAYNDMRDIVAFLSIITGLAIGIACLGLLGMAIFSTETRLKEIGIRKVLGASTSTVVVLLSRDLVRLFSVAAVIVGPLLWLFVNFVFFEQVAHRVELSISMFLPGFVLVALLAFLTIGSQTIKAANGNPVEALKYE